MLYKRRFFISFRAIFQINSKLLTRGYRYHKILKTFGKAYSELLFKLCDISFQEYVSKEISPLPLLTCLQTKEGRRRSEFHFVRLENKRLRRLQYDPEKTICLWLATFTTFYRSFLKPFTLTYNAMGSKLSKHHPRRQGPGPRPLWLLVGTPSALWPELANSLGGTRSTLTDVTIYFH